MDDTWAIRRSVPEDRDALYRVCLATGDAGRDGTALYPDDPHALGRYYVGPYLALEPELALTLTHRGVPVGYCLGARDSEAFYERVRREWLPPLRAAHPMPSGPMEGWTPAQRLHALYHRPDFLVPEGAEPYPAHLHIDLLPAAQGHGLGRRLIGRQLALLGALGVPGVHLAMAPDNVRALGFYTHLGFHRLGLWQETLFLARSLPGGAADRSGEPGNRREGTR